MSWSLSVGYVPPDDVAEKLKAAKDAQLEYQPFDSWDDDVEEQMGAAIKAADEFADLLRGEKHVNVTLNGHARGKGAAPATVYVAVSGVNPPPPAPPPAKK